MQFDDTVAYDDFVAAREKAMELTDTYRQTAADDPLRAGMWDNVMRQTEHARCLLESWLSSEEARPAVQPSSI